MNLSKRQHLPIGIFDSGVGGLTVMQQIIEKLPHEDLIYFGDTARVPYGGKSQETITRYAIESSIFMMELNIKMLVVACNTVSAYAIERLRKIFNIPIIEVITPGAEKAVAVTKSQKIAVLGTKATIQSGAYEREIKLRLPNASVTSIACPMFVPLVEERFIAHPAAELIVQEYLKIVQQSQVDTVLLGCTHYPLLKQLIQRELGNSTLLVDSASTCAEKVAAALNTFEINGNREQIGKHQFFVSDDPAKFQAIGQDFLGHALHEVKLSQ